MRKWLSPSAVRASLAIYAGCVDVFLLNVRHQDVRRQDFSWHGKSRTTGDQPVIRRARVGEGNRLGARELASGNLETMIAGDPGPDWLALPSWRAPRWYLPKEPAEMARASLFLYHPVTRRSRLGWDLTRFLASRGVFGLRRGLPLQPRELWEASGHLVPDGGGLAVPRGNHPSRYVSLVLGDKGRPLAFVKVARDSVGAEALVKEGVAIEKWGSLLSPPLYAPRVLEHRAWALTFEPIKWRARRTPWRMDQDVAYSLGQFFSETTSRRGPPLGVAHGDCAPWNLLRTRFGWTLIDWKNIEEEGLPSFDLFHFFVRSLGELRRPSKRTIFQGLQLRVPVGNAIAVYAAEPELDPHEAEPMFWTYLRRSSTRMKPGVPPRALRIRHKLAQMESSPHDRELGTVPHLHRWRTR